MTDDKELKLQFMLEEGLVVRNSTVENLGDYDTAIDFKRVFFLRNSSKIYHALLIDPHFTQESWKVTGSNMIGPLQTNKFLLTIPAEKENDDVDPPSEIEGTFQSRILWQAFDKRVRTND